MRLVDADKLEIKALNASYWDNQDEDVVWQLIQDAPTEEAVSRSLFEQYKWERDIAIEQLEELGLSLGQKIEGVYLTSKEYEKLLEYKHMYEDLCK